MMRKFIYTLLVLPLIFSCGEDLKPDSSTDVTKEKKVEFSTVKFGSLEIMTKDLGMMKWDDAMKACDDMGDGWRLPTKEELNILFENKDIIGGFAAKFYWCSEDFPKYNDAWEQNFNSGSQLASDKTISNYVRAVRTF